MSYWILFIEKTFCQSLNFIKYCGIFVFEICFLVNFVYLERLSVLQFQSYNFIECRWIFDSAWYPFLLGSEIPVNISGIGLKLVPWYLYVYLICRWNHVISSELMRAICISVLFYFLVNCHCHNWISNDIDIVDVVDCGSSSYFH